MFVVLIQLIIHNCCAKKGICEVKVSTAVLILYCIIVLCIYECTYICIYVCMYVDLNSTLLQCPFCHKNETIDEASHDKNFCLKKLPDGNFQLKQNHAYYYQVYDSTHHCTRTYMCMYTVGSSSTSLYRI